jgi:iron-sulfur cluster repair protein YtfE (RIC family)
VLLQLYQDASQFKVELFQPFGLEDIHAYLKASHAYYIGSCLPEIETLSQQLESELGRENPLSEKIHDFVKDYKAELYEHIEVEEQIILKFVQDILNGQYDKGNRDFFFNHFLHTHNDEIISHLDSLYQEIEEKDQNLKANPTLQGLFKALNSLRKDLEVHNLIEDEIFVLKTLDYVNSRYPEEA